MTFDSKKYRSLIYVLLIAANVLSFSVLAHVLRRSGDPADQARLANGGGVMEQNALERLRERFFPDRAKQAEAARVSKKIAEAEAVIATRPKFSRTSFFFKSPYIGSIALPERWEGKYATRESEQSIDFMYVLPGEAGYPIFNISLVAKKDWEKNKASDSEVKALKELPDQVFTVKLFSTEIAGKLRVEEYARMREEAKVAWNSFKSYEQPKN